MWNFNDKSHLVNAIEKCSRNKDVIFEQGIKKEKKTGTSIFPNEQKLPEDKIYLARKIQPESEPSPFNRIYMDLSLLTEVRVHKNEVQVPILDWHSGEDL